MLSNSVILIVLVLPHHQKDLIIYYLFFKWIGLFAHSIPDSVARPLVLVYYEYSIHYNDDIVAKDLDIKPILVILPANPTHLIQPLNIYVFKPFTSVLKRFAGDFMIEGTNNTTTKEGAMTSGYKSWIDGMLSKTRNINSVFK